jgi:hypothetical protein
MSSVTSAPRWWRIEPVELTPARLRSGRTPSVELSLSRTTRSRRLRQRVPLRSGQVDTTFAIERTSNSNAAGPGSFFGLNVAIRPLTFSVT